MRATIYILLLCIFSCDAPTPLIKGAWKAYSISESKSSFNELFINDRVNPVIYIDDKTIEYPFGFSGLKSLEFNKNFIDYALGDKVLKIEGQEFKIQTITQDSICLKQDNKVVMCLKRLGKASNNTEVKEIKFSLKDEFFNAYVSVSSDGKFLLERSGVLSDTITGVLTEDDRNYLNELVNRIDFSILESNYNPLASDVPNYSLKIAFTNGSKEEVESNGYRAMPDIPYSLSALLYNLDKLSRRKKL